MCSLSLFSTSSSGPSNTDTMENFEERVAVITGGASGIGLGMARAFAGAGMKLVIADPIPFFPVPLTGELFDINRTYVLDGRSTVPQRQLVFTDGINHSVPNTKQKILTDRWPFFSRAVWDHIIDETGKVKISIHLLCHPQ